jgi:hypothetical protein
MELGSRRTCSKHDCIGGLLIHELEVRFRKSYPGGRRQAFWPTFTCCGATNSNVNIEIDAFSTATQPPTSHKMSADKSKDKPKVHKLSLKGITLCHLKVAKANNSQVRQNTLLNL